MIFPRCSCKINCMGDNVPVFSKLLSGLSPNKDKVESSQCRHPKMSSSGICMVPALIIETSILGFSYCWLLIKMLKWILFFIRNTWIRRNIRQYFGWIIVAHPLSGGFRGCSWGQLSPIPSTIWKTLSAHFQEVWSPSNNMVLDISAW